MQHLVRQGPPSSVLGRLHGQQRDGAEATLAAAGKCEYGGSTPASHLRRQLLPERPLMPLAMMDQFLGPYSFMSCRSRSSS